MLSCLVSPELTGHWIFYPEESLKCRIKALKDEILLNLNTGLVLRPQPCSRVVLLPALSASPPQLKHQWTPQPWNLSSSLTCARTYWASLRQNYVQLLVMIYLQLNLNCRRWRHSCNTSRIGVTKRNCGGIGTHPIILHWWYCCNSKLRLIVNLTAEMKIYMGDMAVFPDHTAKIAWAGAAFNEVTCQLRGMEGVRYGLIHPAPLRISYGDEEKVIVTRRSSNLHRENKHRNQRW